MATNTHISVRGAQPAGSCSSHVTTVLAAIALGKKVTTSNASGRVEASASYHWPVKPFDRQHPVRGNFGDPRTIFSSSATLNGVLTGDCSCDFTAALTSPRPTGRPSTRSRPARSRTSTTNGSGSSRAAATPSSTGTSTPSVGVGAHRQGVPDRARPHLPRLRPRPPDRAGRRAEYVNPLAPGHIGPYDRPHDAPRDLDLASTRVETARDGLPNLVRGRVHPRRGGRGRADDRCAQRLARDAGRAGAAHLADPLLERRVVTRPADRGRLPHDAARTEASGRSTPAARTRTWPRSGTTTPGASRARTSSS